jgi:hypothetical protein
VAEAYIVTLYFSEKRREGDPKVWSAVLITALGSWEKPVSRGLSSEKETLNKDGLQR